MVWWRRLLLVPLVALVLGGGLTVVLAPPAAACSCADLGSDEMWAEADVVVSGRLVDRQGEPETGDRIVYEVAVTSVYKGDATEVLTFTTESYGTACGWHPELSDDDQVIVLSDVPDLGLTTSTCSMYAALPVPDSYVGTEVPPAPGGTGIDPDPGDPAPGVDDDAPPGGETGWWLLWVALAAGAAVLTTAWLVLRRPLR